MSALSFRPYLPKDAEALADLFVAAIDELTEEFYSPGQRAAWASRADDVAAFGARLGAMVTIIAETKGEILGFASLKDDKVIEMLYVGPDHAGRGIGRALVGVMELLAQKRGTEALSVDASEAAFRLFEKLGYEMQARNTVNIDDEWLANTTMKKTLAKAAQDVGNA